VRPNPDAGATGAGGAPVDPPLTDTLIMSMDTGTFNRRWGEIESYMNNRGRR